MSLPYGRILLFSVEASYAQRAKPVAFGRSCCFFMSLPYGRVLLFSVETSYNRVAKPVAFWPFLLLFMSMPYGRVLRFSVEASCAQRAKPVAFWRSCCFRLLISYRLWQQKIRQNQPIWWVNFELQAFFYTFTPPTLKFLWRKRSTNRRQSAIVRLLRL